MTNNTEFITGVCLSCGQISNLSSEDYETQDMANEYATMHCNCLDSVTYRAKKRAEKKREEALLKADLLIDNQFGEPAEENGFTKVSSAIRELLLNICTLVYDAKLKDVTLNISSCLKAKVSKSAKDNLQITRFDTSVYKNEV